MGPGGPRGLQILRSGVSVRGGFDSHAFPPIFVACVVALLVLGGLRPAQAGARIPGAAFDAAAATDSTAPDSVAAVVAFADSAATDSAGPADSARVSPGAAAGLLGDSLLFSAADTVAAIANPRAGRRAAAPPPPHRLARLGRFDQPRWVMLRSLLVPGWGQAHNRAWLKAVVVAIGDGALRWRFVRDEMRLNDLGRDADSHLAALTAAAGDTAATGEAYRAALASGDPQQIADAEAALNAANARLRSASDEYNQTVNLFNALLDKSVNRRWILGGVVLYSLIDAYVDAHFRRFDVDFQFDPALPGGPPDPGARLRLRWTF